MNGRKPIKTCGMWNCDYPATILVYYNFEDSLYDGPDKKGAICQRCWQSNKVNSEAIIIKHLPLKEVKDAV